MKAKTINKTGLKIVKSKPVTKIDSYDLKKKVKKIKEISLTKQIEKHFEHFSLNQQAAIRKGSAIAQRLVDVVNTACDRKDQSTYIYSHPGYGKTYTVTHALSLRDIDHHEITGNTSMFGFCMSIAIIDHLTPKDESVVVVIDDCDEILKNEMNINVVKSVLEGARLLKYNKSMGALKSDLTELQQAAIESHANPNGLGFIVDCSNMKFIFTSNKRLPDKQDVEKKPSAINHHLYAIRSRCNTQDFEYVWDEMWGWLVNIVMTAEVEHVKLLTLQQKLTLLDWMYNNWARMTETSIRTCSKMAREMLDKPKIYKTNWELDFLNQ